MKLKELAIIARGVEGWLSFQEGAFLYAAARRAKNPIVEIGSYKGKSTIYLAGGIKENLVYSIDPHIGSPEKEYEFGKIDTYSEFLSNIKIAGLEGKVVPVRETSREASRKFSEPISLLFIDGSHTWENAAKDLTSWVDKVQDKGMVAVHDASSLVGPWKAVKKYMFFSRNFHSINIIGSIVFGRYSPEKSIFYLIGNIFSYLYVSTYVFLRKLPFFKKLRKSIKIWNFKHKIKTVNKG